MKNQLHKTLLYFYRLFLSLPIFKKYRNIWYKKLGVKAHTSSKISPDIMVIGEYSNIVLGKNSEINAGCFFLSKDRIELGDNSTLAYKVKVLTSANPNGPHNKLSRIYPKMKAPVIIGKNCWVGAGAIILPGIKIGDFSIVAAGSIVTKDVPSYTVVGGNPAREIKKLNSKDFI